MINAQPPSQSRLVIPGATGMVGGYALRYTLDHPAVGAVTMIGRRKLGIAHPKLKEVLHQDFADCSPLTDPLSDQDAAVFCLGGHRLEGPVVMASWDDALQPAMQTRQMAIAEEA